MAAVEMPSRDYPCPCQQGYYDITCNCTTTGPNISVPFENVASTMTIEEERAIFGEEKPPPKKRKPKDRRCKAHRQFHCTAHTCR